MFLILSAVVFSHLRLLTVFTSVVGSGRFAGAARKLKSSRSRVSEQVAALESDLGIRIGFPKDDSLIARIMHEERFGLFASRVYLEKFGTPKILINLETHRWVTFIQGDHSEIEHLWQHKKRLEIKPANFYRCNLPLSNSATKMGSGRLIAHHSETRDRMGRASAFNTVNYQRTLSTFIGLSLLTASIS